MTNTTLSVKKCYTVGATDNNSQKWMTGDRNNQIQKLAWSILDCLNNQRWVLMFDSLIYYNISAKDL